MAINAGDNTPEIIQNEVPESQDGFVVSAFNSIKTHSQAALLGLGIGLGGAGAATAEDVRVAQADIPLAVVTDATHVVDEVEIAKGNPFIRKTLKEFVDEGLYEKIDALPDTYIQHIKPIFIGILGVEDEKMQGFLARNIIALFLSPNVRSYNRIAKRFGDLGVNISDETIAVTGEFLGMEQDKIEFKRGGIRLALADRQEILERQQQRLKEVNILIKNLTARSAELTARSAELTARSAELTARSAELTARSAELTARSAELTARSAELTARSAELDEELLRLQSLKQQILENIEEIKTVASTSTG